MGRQLKGFFRDCCSDLMAAYEAAWELPEVTSHIDAVKRAIKMPAPRYWISPEMAAKNIVRMDRGKKPDIVKGSDRYVALMALYREYKILRETKFKTESTLFVVAFACLKPAPRFYISAFRARRIIDKIRNGDYLL